MSILNIKTFSIFILFLLCINAQEINNNQILINKYNDDEYNNIFIYLTLLFLI